MNANAADFGSTALSALLRAVGLLVLAVGAALAFVFAQRAAQLFTTLVAEL